MQDTTPIYSNTNSDRYRPQYQGMTYGETLAHHLQHTTGQNENTQGVYIKQKWAEIYLNNSQMKIICLISIVCI